MQVQFAAVADYANVADGGKLNVMGVFDRIGAPKFPAAHPAMVFVVRFRVGFEDSGKEHPFSVVLEDEDGRKLVEINGKVGVKKVPAGATQTLNQILQFANLVFPRAGTYCFRVTSSGAALAEVPLALVTTGPS